jgi:hypothetical protein
MLDNLLADLITVDNDGLRLIRRPEQNHLRREKHPCRPAAHEGRQRRQQIHLRLW